MWRFGLWALALLGACRERPASTPAETDEAPPPPQWYFGAVTEGLSDAPLTALWGRSDGVLYAVGHYGTILRGTFPPGQSNGVWERMASPTQAHLTALAGVENGQRFGLPATEGELFAVGWYGTILHYHPNPDDDPATSDGAWEIVSGPGGPELTTRVRVDPACPDYDGDGVADDGDGDGFWGNAVCANNQTAACDDNCRESANGTLRPIADLNGDACIGPGDGPDPDTSKIQRDSDRDGLGEVCDDDDGTPRPLQAFDATLFGVWARAQGPDLLVVAVGEAGAIATYDGPTPADLGPGQPALTDPTAWLAQLGLPFRYMTDCPPGTPAGQVCAGSGKLPPSCPAQCNIRRTSCTCPVAQGQCCDPTASTGVGCGDGSCGPAQNGCDVATGLCSSLCPDCFRRLGETLRGVSGNNTRVVAVGASGTIVVGDPASITQPWRAPSCAPAPAPYDELPLLTAASRPPGTDVTLVVGAAGAVFEANAALPNACSLTSRLGAPPAFLAAVFSTQQGGGYAVGDHGLVLRVNPNATPAVSTLPSGLGENLFGVWVNADPTFDPIQNPNGPGIQLWVVGAGGNVVLGRFY